LEKDIATTLRIFNDWFAEGKNLKEEFFTDLHLDLNNPAVEREFQQHENWKEKTQIRATPTILVNGCQLPDNYKIEDLKYFTEY
jgi:protein-disulfide isomerase